MAATTEDHWQDCTQDEFDNHVRAVAHAMGTDAILDIPGVWEVVSEELNNTSLESWARANGRDEETGEPLNQYD